MLVQHDSVFIFVGIFLSSQVSEFIHQIWHNNRAIFWISVAKKKQNYLLFLVTWDFFKQPRENYLLSFFPSSWILAALREFIQQCSHLWSLFISQACQLIWSTMVATINSWRSVINAEKIAGPKEERASMVS